MKKICCYVICLSFIICLTGCNNDNNNKESLRELTDKYYKEFVLNRIENLDSLELTIDDFKTVKYDTTKLKKCENNTKVVANIKNNKIISYNYELNCK